MSKNIQKISINKLESVLVENTVTEILNGTDNVEIHIAKTLTLHEMLLFVQEVVEACIDGETGEYLPEAYDFAIRAGVLSGEGEVTMAGAITLAIGIAIQNFPEGAIISLPLRSEGHSKGKAFALGALSGIVEPIGAILAILLASLVTPILPYLLAFAAGAMIYVVVEELIPEGNVGEHSNLGTIFFAVGFALMMVLDVALG